MIGGPAELRSVPGTYARHMMVSQATYLSASDVVAALTALLEQPMSVRDDATPRDRFWCVVIPLQQPWWEPPGHPIPRGGPLQLVQPG
jgi:hypothetical protein